MLHLKSFAIFESKSTISFNKQPKKKGAKTDVYNVVKSGNTIGQIKWSSRMRGYAFLPTQDCDSEIKDFVKDLMSKRRAEKKKNKVNENHNDRSGSEDYYEYVNWHLLLMDYERGKNVEYSFIKKIINKYPNLEYSNHVIDKKQNKFESSYGWKNGIKTIIFSNSKDYDHIEFAINEVNDDYYIIRIFYLKSNSYGHSSNEICYKCDQLDGLYKCIEDKILNS